MSTLHDDARKVAAAAREVGRALAAALPHPPAIYRDLDAGWVLEAGRPGGMTLHLSYDTGRALAHAAWKWRRTIWDCIRPQKSAA